MNTNEILQLIQTLKETGFNHIDVSHEGSHILLSNAEYAGAQMVASVPSHQVPSHNQHSFSENAVIHTGNSNNDGIAHNISESKSSEAISKNNDYVSHENTQNIEPKDLGGHLVESPIVGTFYAASGPDVENFVSLGSVVKKGDVLCIIEAMKLMNEIESDVAGEIVEILVNNEEGVEYGQPLFRIV